MVPQAVFTCMIEHRCMVPIIKWYYHSPDNSTIKVIKVTRFLYFLGLIGIAMVEGERDEDL
jgi:hypothetical protein